MNLSVLKAEIARLKAERSKVIVGYLPAGTVAEEEVTVYSEGDMNKLFISSETISYKSCPIGQYDNVIYL